MTGAFFTLLSKGVGRGFVACRAQNSGKNVPKLVMHEMRLARHCHSTCKTEVRTNDSSRVANYEKSRDTHAYKFKTNKSMNY